MIGYLHTNVKSECFGCGACYQACPKQAIRMVQDEEGFLYPAITRELCISCQLCHRVCPAEGVRSMNKPFTALVGYSVDKSIRCKSASGGAFYGIVEAALEDDIVFGAEWNSRSSVHHLGVPAKEAYNRFYKSKYVQSNIGEAYITVKDCLHNDKTVIFTGTPCQIAGLKTFLGKEYDRLLCVDLVCHGVPSGKVLETYLKDVETGGDSIVSIAFRHKECAKEKWDSKKAQLIYESGREQIVDYDSSGFLRGFANGLFFRPSCSTCPFAYVNRVSDLTIGDAWGIDKEYPEFNPHEGVSLVLVNTKKGKQYSERMRKYMYMKEVDLEIAVSGNARLRKPDVGHKDREHFFDKLNKISFEKLVQCYIPRISLVRKIGHSIKMKLRKR